MKKSRIIAFLSIALVVVSVTVASVVFLTSPAEAISYTEWSGTEGFAGGSGTKDDPYQIATPNQLAQFRTLLGTYKEDSALIDVKVGSTTVSVKYENFKKSYFELTSDIVFNDVTKLDTADKIRAWGDAATGESGGATISFSHNGTSYSIADYHTWLSPAALKPQSQTSYSNEGVTDEATITSNNESYSAYKKKCSMERFQGQFDGNGYTIYGLCINYPDYQWIGFLGTGRYCTVKDLTFDRCYVNGGAYTAMIIGNPRVAVDINNCTVGAACYIEGEKIVGGIVGGNTTATFTSDNLDEKLASESSMPNFTISRCTNYGTIVARDYAGGGIVGFSNAGAARVSIDYCVNRGNVSAKQWAGGILGGVRNVDGYGHNDIEYCRNYGDVSSVGNDTTAGAYAGGIVGKGCAVDVYDCVNYGNVSCTVNATAQAAGKTSSYLGGISGGSGVYDNLDNSSIIYCYNYGTVSAPAEAKCVYVGGIVGRAISVDVEQCANEGDVSGHKCVGGIVGDSCSPKANGDIRVCYVLDCINTGTVSGTTADTSTYYISGLVGRANWYSATIRAYIARSVSVGEVPSGYAFTIENNTPTDDTSTDAPSTDGDTSTGEDGTTDGEYDDALEGGDTGDDVTSDTGDTGTTDTETDTDYDPGRPDLTAEDKNTCVEKASCFALTSFFSSNTENDKGTLVTAFSLNSVIEELGSNWTPNYPYPTLNNLWIVTMEPSGEGGILTLGELSCVRNSSGTVGIEATVIFGKEDFLATCTGTEAGILAAWADSLAGNPLLISTTGAAKSVCDNVSDFTVNSYGKATFYYTDGNYGDTLVIRAYIKTTDTDGNTVYCYSSPRYTTAFDATGSDDILATDSELSINLDVDNAAPGSAKGKKVLWLTTRVDSNGSANDSSVYKKTVTFDINHPADTTVSYSYSYHSDVMNADFNNVDKGYFVLAADNDTTDYDADDTTYKNYEGVERSGEVTILPVTLTATIQKDGAAIGECSDTVYLCVISAAGTTVSSTYANKFALHDNKFYLQTNTLNYQEYTISKNDGYIMYYNGTVIMIDGGNANTGSLGHLLDIREKFIKQGVYGSDKTTYLGDGYQEERRALSKNCKLSVIVLITHYHSDHVGAVRDVITESPFIEITEYVTPAKPTGITAAGYSGHMTNWWNKTQTAISNQNAITTGYLGSSTKHTLSYETAYSFYIGSANDKFASRKDNFITGSEYTANLAAATDQQAYKERYRIKIYAMMPEDYTLNANVNTDSTAWVNSNSVWYMIRIGNADLGDTLTKALFTGDTYVPDTGNTYTLYYYDTEATAANGKNTWTAITGNSPVDAMIARYGRTSADGKGKNYVTHSIDILECNHHGRGAYSENLFTITQPALTFTGLYYGHSDIRLINKAIQTGTIYIMGDGAKLFTVGLDGTINDVSRSEVKNMDLSYEAIGTVKDNGDGTTSTTYTARRVRHEDLRFGTGDEMSVSISWGNLDFTYIATDWNTATHKYDSGSWETDTASVTVTNTGEAYVHYKAEFVSANSHINGTLSGGTDTVLMPSETGTITLKLDGTPLYTMRDTVVGAIIITFEGEN